MTFIFTNCYSSQYFSHTSQLIVPAMPGQIKGRPLTFAKSWLIMENKKEKLELHMAKIP